MRTRSYRSVSLTAARATSTSGTGPAWLWPCSAAGEDQQVLAVAAHHGGEVVELEEGGEAVGVLLALLQVLDHRQLPLDQAERAQRQIDEGTVDGLAGPLQMGGGGGQLLAEGVALLGHRDPLADQVLTVGLQAGEPLVQAGEVGVEGVDRADDLGELVVAAGELDRLLARRVGGETGGAQAQHGQRPGQRAGHAHAHADREQQAEPDQPDLDLQGEHVLVALLGELPGAGRRQRVLHAAHLLDAGGEGGVDLVGLERGVLVGEGRRAGEPRQVLLGGGHLGPADRVPVRRLVLRGRAPLERRQRGPLGDLRLLGGGAQGVAGPRLLGGPGLGLHGQAGDGVDAGLRGAARHGEGGEQQAPGGGGLLDGAVEVGEGELLSRCAWGAWRPVPGRCCGVR